MAHEINFVIAGIDLAAKPKNPSGICLFESMDKYELFTLYGDEEIVEAVNGKNAEIIAIDAPLMEEIRIREADRTLKKYGAMPPTMPGMRLLVKRAKKLVRLLNGVVIEVFPTASAKILGIYDKDYRKMVGKLNVEVKNKHELDAYIAAYTGYLYKKGLCEEVGNKEKIIIPKKI